MEIINKMKKREEKQWHLGDVVEEEEGHKAMTFQDEELFRYFTDWEINYGDSST